MSIANRIERLEQAAAIGEPAGVSPETFRKVLATIQRDETAIDLLRQAALVECSERWRLSPNASQEFRAIIDRLDAQRLAASDKHEAAKRLRDEANSRLKALIAAEFGQQVATQFFAGSD
jgi:hypothetical protein